MAEPGGFDVANAGGYSVHFIFFIDHLEGVVFLKTEEINNPSIYIGQIVHQKRRGPGIYNGLVERILNDARKRGGDGIYPVFSLVGYYRVSQLDHHVVDGIGLIDEIFGCF